MNARLTAALVLLVMTAACVSSSPATFSLAGASVDPAYWCPGGSTDAPYTVNATVSARNDTSKAVTVRSATAEMELSAVTGNWLEHVGDRYTTSDLVVTPNTVAARSTATLKVAIPSACTSALYGAGNSSSGTYEVKIHIVTSDGTYSITSANKHEILAA